jgi:NAD(P)-dependent dehydrogenase (short-subunit alcohol dehydrogenase family)
MHLQLEGKTALVTGSSRGIGEAIARTLAPEGAHVLVHGRQRARADAVAASIVASGGRATAIVGDLTRDEDVSRMLDHGLRAVGSIDILVNNAGGSAKSTQRWSNTHAGAWTEAFDRNVLAALRVTTAVLPAMRAARWGRIVFVSSTAATMPPARTPDYSASKAAMNAMVASLAKEVAEEGITVNAISPGTVKSDALEARFREVALEQGLVDEGAPWEAIERAALPLFAEVPMRRVGRLDEIAAAAAFLVSDMAGYITGVNLRVDGGQSPSL